MKHALTILLATLATGSALAQSSNSVELYGVADAYVGSHSVYQYTGYDAVSGKFIASKTGQAVVESGGLTPSRIGIRVREGLGNGLNAIAVWEEGVLLDSGAKDTGENLSFVGLQSDSWGSLSLGRHATSYDDTFAAMNAQGKSSFGAANGLPISAAGMTQIAAFRLCQTQGACAGDAGVLADTLGVINGNGYAGRTGAFVGYNNRFDNSIRYDSPDFNGFSGSFTVGLGENKNGVSKATVNSSFSLSYANGPLSLAVAHQSDEEQAPTPIILPGSGSSVGITPAGGIVKLRNTLVAGAYDFGAVRVNAGFNTAKYNLTGVKTQKEIFLGATVPMGALTLVGQFARSEGNSLDDASSFAGEAHYALSKRSTVYAAFNHSKLPAYKNNTLGFGLRHVF